ncbi:methylcobamide--CoM methyltransferase [Clostridium sporogenes]|nr:MULTISPECIES: methylcobamide--CoM methyltransferase [Clostridium]STC77247.1 methylcobamide:CoM methyltransferase [Clostridium botulinum]EHN16299.1 putative methylcobalamin:coenzyme M methyltransferase [Clostridium sporogenes PA 3679]KOY65247.1 methylcobamide--CoM methyltransferase [Clostridium sporogenes]KYN78404.1 methylcobamide--CoM methyltransferase [Clostridium sporogenes]MBA4506964.1 methylcobamide--CoM methyltransferase [Clostridium sporogenes]
MDTFKDEMTVKERSEAYFKGEEVDRLPCAIMFEETAAVYAGISTKEYYFDADKMLEAEKFKVRELGAESAGINVTLRGMGEALGSKMGYPNDRASYLIDPVLKDYKMLDNMDVVNPYKDGRLPITLKALGKIKKELGNEVNIGSGISGPISAASAVRGTNNLMRDFVKNKEGIHKLLDFMTECNLAFVKAVYDEYGLVCGIGDPLSCGNLISDKQFEKFVEPYLIKTIDGIYKITGQKPFLHICGKTKHIWNRLGRMNISTFSVDNCEDIGELKDVLGDKVCIVGNVDPVSIIRNGTVEDVYNAVKLCIEKAGDSPKGYIVGSGCDIPSGAPVENIKAMIEATKKYSRGIRIGRGI